MSFGIDDNDFKRIVDILKLNKKISTAILFGSRAKGSFEPGSDIDIAIKGSELNLNVIIELKITLDDLLLPYKFDIVIYDIVNS